MLRNRSVGVRVRVRYHHEGTWVDGVPAAAAAETTPFLYSSHDRAGTKALLVYQYMENKEILVSNKKVFLF